MGHPQFRTGVKATILQANELSVLEGFFLPWHLPLESGRFRSDERKELGVCWFF